MISQAVLAGAMWLFNSCAAQDGALKPPPAIMAGIAMQESGFHPDAIHDNSPSPGYPRGRSYFPGDPNAAVDLAVQLRAQDHIIDVGLLGIDYTDWQRHGVPLVAAFDECANVRISSEILIGDYATAIKSGYRGRNAWVVALSRYNTGGVNSTGIRYAESVLANAQALWPRVAAMASPGANISLLTPTSAAQSYVARPAQRAPARATLSEAILRARARQAQAAKAYAQIERDAKARAGEQP